MRNFVFGILAFMMVASPVVAGITDDGCLVCHRLKGLSVVTSNNKVKNCSVSPALYLHSIHRNVGCTECHSKIKAYPHNPANVKANCANKCHMINPSTGKSFSHASIFKTWKESVHGKYYDKAPDIYPSCSYCHTNRLLINVKKFESLNHSFYRCLACHKEKGWTYDRLSHVASRMDVPIIKNGFVSSYLRPGVPKYEINELCESCHANEKMMKKAIKIQGIHNKFYKEHILTAVEGYKMTMHSKMLYLDRSDQRAADCLDCHVNKDGNFHDIFPKSDPRSSINVKNIELTCGKASECHPFVPKYHMKNFATTEWVHFHPIPSSLGQKIVGYVEEFMFWLTWSVLLLAALITGLDLIQILRRK